MSTHTESGNSIVLFHFKNTIRSVLTAIHTRLNTTAIRKQLRVLKGANAEPAPKAEFSDLCHSLRTPLNAIIGFSELMSAQIYGPLGHNKYQDYSSAIAQSGQELLQQIETLLNERAFNAEANSEPEKTIRRATAGLRTLASQQTAYAITPPANSNTIH